MGKNYQMVTHVAKFLLILTIFLLRCLLNQDDLKYLDYAAY